MNRLQASRALLAMACVAAWLGAAVAADRSPAAMAEAATRFLGALTPEQRRHAALAFTSPERERWGFDPTEMFPRQGLPMSEMSESQRNIAHALLRSGLSERGYLMATSIMDRERIIQALERAGGGDPVRARVRPVAHDPLKYYVSVFGTPSAGGTWSWRAEGHHLSLNFTIVKGSLVASTPSFFGAYPATVEDGPKTVSRILSAEEDAGRALLMALDDRQRARVVIVRTAPNDISTTNQTTARPLPPVGVSAADMRPDQRELLMRLIQTYTSAMAADIAADRMTRLREAGADRIIFSWAGEAERGKPHYYRLLGPTFLVEYSNAQDNANHVHSVWRDFEGDFGRDLLRERVRTAQ